MNKNILPLLIGIVIMVIGNLPSVVHSIFPANLIPCVVGGLLTGHYAAKLLMDKE